MEINLEIDAKAKIGEGPIWSEAENRLYWIDIDDYKLFRFDPVTGRNEVFNIDQPVGTVVPVSPNKVMLGIKDGIAYYDLTVKEMTLLYPLGPDMPNNRCNDGKCDPAGRFWVGTQDNELKDGAGALYCLDLDGTVHKKLEGLKNPNGIVWSLDHKAMYFIDTYTRKVDAFDFDIDTGNIANKRTAVIIPVEFGVPDGMTMDINGNIWIGHFFGACISSWNPRSGALLQKIDIPSKNVTACWFGGKDMMTLYVTTARAHTDKENLIKYPHAGGLFSIHTQVAGLPGQPYLGKI